MSRVAGCEIREFAPNSEEVQNVLEWLAGSTRPASLSGTFGWLLAHCDDGIVWGQLADGDIWVLSSGLFSGISPSIEADGKNIQQLRLFGPREELILWRTPQGLRGRVLSDTPEPTEASLIPTTECYVVLGNELVERQGMSNGFVWVADPAGREQVVPLPSSCTAEDFESGRYPLRLKIKHFYEQDNGTGAVRVAVSRLVRLFPDSRLDHAEVSP